MSSRIATADRQFILSEMLALARYLTGQSVQAPQVRAAVRRLRDDLLALIRAGSTGITVDQHSYLETIQQENEKQ